jgi:7-cyano-7-deazaguanine synthase
MPKESNKIDLHSVYIPARNTIFLAYALGWAEVIGAQSIFIGVVKTQTAPDTRPNYIKAFEIMSNLAAESNKRISIVTPFANNTKVEVLSKAIELGVDYSLTRSCNLLSKEDVSCGICPSCINRLEAFYTMGITDPIKYQ